MGSIEQKPAVFVIDPYHDTAIAKLQEHSDKFELILPSDSKRSLYLERATAILMRSETRISTNDIENANANLRYIIKQGVGVDNIAVEAANERGIKVYNTPGLNSEAVAELTIGLAFCIARRITEFDLRLRQGDKIVRSKNLGKSLFGKSLGVVGMGAIGYEVARKWTGAMSGSVIAYDPFAPAGAWENKFDKERFTRTKTLEQLLSLSDVITLHVPETAATRNMLSHKQFSLMKEGSILLNCARGGVVDEEALLEALSSGRLFGAGLDAVAHEPPSLATYGTTLLNHPRVVITPHIGASTEENQIQSGLAAVQILLDLLNGSGSAPKALNS